MRVTKENSRIDYHEYYGERTCDIRVPGWSMECETVRTLEFPKTIRYDGKTYKVTRIFWEKYKYGSIERMFPNLKRVRVPMELEHDFFLDRSELEIITY